MRSPALVSQHSSSRSTATRRGALLCAVALCCAASAAACRNTPAQAADQLAAALRQAVEGHEEVHSAVLRVDAPRLGLSFVDAYGDAGAGRAFTPDTPFLSASIGKLFVAATILALAHEGVLGLDQPVAAFVGADELDGLPVVGGDAAMSAVTIEQLLTHRSGLPDYFSESPSNDGAPSVVEVMKAHPQQTWTRRQLLDYTRAHFDPAGAPGVTFAYADTNYDLLGVVLEGATGKPFHVVVADTLLRPLGLNDTWYYNLTDAPRDAPADAYIDDVNLGGAPCLTADGAGGGLATTTADLQTFMRALVRGEPVSLRALAAHTTPDAIIAGIDYGRGLWTVRPGAIFFTLGGLPEARGVSGATGSFVYYVERDDAVISGTFNQTAWSDDHISFLLGDVLPVLAGLQQ